MLSWVRRYIPEPDISRLLLQGDGDDDWEVVVDQVQHHWVVFLKPLGWFLLSLLSLGLFAFTGLDTAWLPLVLSAGFLGWAAYKAGLQHYDRFVITDMRVFRVHGLIGRTHATMPLSRILDITVEKPLLGRLLGYGHFTFESAAQAQGLRDIRYISRIDERELVIQRVVQRAGLRGPRMK